MLILLTVLTVLNYSHNVVCLHVYCRSFIAIIITIIIISTRRYCAMSCLFIGWFVRSFANASVRSLMRNTYRRRDDTVELRRVGVGGV